MNVVQEKELFLKKMESGNIIAKRAVRVIDYLQDRLTAAEIENIRLNDVLQQQFKVWEDVDSCVRPLTKLGASVSENALRLLQERDQLRTIISECAKAVGIYLSHDVSNEFITDLPKEIEMCVSKLRAQLAEQTTPAEGVHVITDEQGRPMTYWGGKTNESPKVEQVSGGGEPVSYQFKDRGKWCNFIDDKHMRNTIEAGYMVRPLYLHPSPNKADVPDYSSWAEILVRLQDLRIFENGMGDNCVRLDQVVELINSSLPPLKDE